MAKNAGNLTFRSADTAVRFRAMGTNSLITLLDAARARLEERLRRVNEDIRAYPQPIARCDVQLGGLLAERSQIRAEIDKLQRMQETLSTR